MLSTDLIKLFLHKLISFPCRNPGQASGEPPVLEPGGTVPRAGGAAQYERRAGVHRHRRRRAHRHAVRRTLHGDRRRVGSDRPLRPHRSVNTQRGLCLHTALTDFLSDCEKLSNKNGLSSNVQKLTCRSESDSKSLFSFRYQWVSKPFDQIGQFI